MKKILYGFLLSFTALSIVSCDYNDPNDGKFHSDPESGWVEFPQTNVVVTTNADCPLIQIPINLDAPVNKSGVYINYTITDVVGSTAGLNTFASVPAGTTQGNFVITNANTITSPIEFTLTLVSTSKSNVSVGGPNSIAGEQTITVKVIPGLAYYVGGYNVLETSAAGDFNYVSQVVVGNDPNEIIISNVYDINPGSQTSIFINPDGTVSFPDFADNLLIPGAFFQGLDGTVDPCTGEIELDFNLVNAAGTVLEGPVTITLTRQ